MRNAGHRRHRSRDATATDMRSTMHNARLTSTSPTSSVSDAALFCAYRSMPREWPPCTSSATPTSWRPNAARPLDAARINPVCAPQAQHVSPRATQQHTGTHEETTVGQRVAWWLGTHLNVAREVHARLVGRDHHHVAQPQLREVLHGKAHASQRVHGNVGCEKALLRGKK